MAQWGTGTGDADQRPNWYTDTTGTVDSALDEATSNNVVYTRANYPPEAENLEATELGWERVIRYTDGDSVDREKREVVVANAGLATKLGDPEIVDIRFSVPYTTDLTNGVDAVGVVVTFNQPVAVYGTPEFTVAVSGTTDPTCEFVSGNTSNKLVFTDGTVLAGPTSGETLSVGVDQLAISGTSAIVAWNAANNSGAANSFPERTADLTHVAAIGISAGVKVVI